MTTKATIPHSKLTSKTWLINWFSQLTINHKQQQEKEKEPPSSMILPWKRDSTNKSLPTSSIAIHSPIMNNIKRKRKKNSTSTRPSITISLSPSSAEERRNSQQSSITTATEEEYLRRDSVHSDRSSILSELWQKGKRYQQKRHSPQHLRPSSIDYCDSLPASYHQRTPNYMTMIHQKRYSISSSYDNTPAHSRPSSVIYSQTDSPNFTSTSLIPKKRWEIKHDLTKLAIDGLFSIPELVTQQSSTEKRVLQIGCGESHWGIDVAKQHSKWTVIGLDVDDETTMTNKPKNFKLMACTTLLEGLCNMPDHSFDIISSRFLVLDYSLTEYQNLITQCTRLCKPGGFIEVVEMDLRIYHQRLLSNSITHVLNTEVIKNLEHKMLDPRLARKLNELVVSDDLSTQVKYISLPLGVWGGRIGVMFRENVHLLIESFQTDIAEQNNKSVRTEAELDYKMDLMDNEMDSNRAFMNLHIMVVQI